MVASLRPERSVQWADPSAAERGKVKVKAMRLSSLLDCDVDFLKMDIEGAEQQVLEEAPPSATLRRVRTMAIEYHHHISPKDDALAKFLRILEDHGFGYQLRELRSAISTFATYSKTCSSWPIDATATASESPRCPASTRPRACDTLSRRHCPLRPAASCSTD